MKMFVVAVCVGFCTFGEALAANPPQYTLTDLGAGMSPLAINDSGQIVGFRNIGGLAKAFLISGNTFTDLSYLGGASLACGINSSGHVLISGDHPAIYDTNGMHPLPSPANSTGIQPYGINDNNIVCAGAIVSGFSRAFIYDGTAFTNITPGNDQAVAYAINNNDWVAGKGYNPDPHAFVYKPGIGSGYTPRLSVDTQAWETGINQAGDVIGDGPALFAAYNRAFLYTHTGTLTELAPLVLPGLVFNAYAGAMNDKGLVVGHCGNENSPDPGAIRATFWSTDGTPTLLENAVDSSGQGWTLARANDVNNSGQIVGYGWYDPDGFGPIEPEARGFLLTLTPLPEPSVANFSLAALWIHQLTRRRRGPGIGK